MSKEFKQEFSIKSIPTDDTLLLENTLNAMSLSGWELYSIYEAEQNSKIVYNCIFVKETQVTDDEITDELMAEYTNPDSDKYKAMVQDICDKLGFDSLGYQSLDGLLEAIGIDKDKICTYCWNGKG